MIDIALTHLAHSAIACNLQVFSFFWLFADRWNLPLYNEVWRSARAARCEASAQRRKSFFLSFSIVANFFLCLSSQKFLKKFFLAALGSGLDKRKNLLFATA